MSGASHSAPSQHHQNCCQTTFTNGERQQGLQEPNANSMNCARVNANVSQNDAGYNPKSESHLVLQLSVTDMKELAP